MSIPKNAKEGGKFHVSVPKLIESPEGQENTFPKALQLALGEYHQAYDDWCETEAKYRAECPDDMSKKDSFKPGVERLKKYDKMLKRFPQDLVTPIDVAFIRKIVRRVRQNAQKRRKSKGDGESIPGSPAPTVKDNDADAAKEELVKVDANAPSQTIEVRVPGKGTKFPSAPFNEDDFSTSKKRT